MRTIEVKLFQFDELSDKAKEKARDWYREGYDFDANLEPAETAAKLLGITFGVRTVPLMSGKTRQEVDIRYSGFSSQGDGASFVGSYEYAKGCSKAVRSEFGKDETLWTIADGLTALQKANGYRLKANITQSGRGVHKYTMDIQITEPQSVIDADTSHYEPSGVFVRSEPLESLTELMRDFAQWIYDGLEEDFNYLTSDEAVDESITANEYEFYEDGRRARE